MATALHRAAGRVLARSTPHPGPLTTACLIFGGSLNRDGYGQVMVKGAGGKLLTHRVVYAVHVGDPHGLDVHHRCERPACVNPDHLQALTRLDHIHTGRSPSALFALRETCAAGHPLDGTHRRNRDVRPARRCLTCHREQERDRRARRAAEASMAA